MLQKIFIVHGRAWPFFVVLLCLGASRNSTAQEQLTLLPNAASPEPGIIVGTVIDVNDDAIPGATVVLQGAALKSPRTLASDDRDFSNSKVSSLKHIVSRSAPRDSETGFRRT